MDPLVVTSGGFKFDWRNGDMVDPHSGLVKKQKGKGQSGSLTPLAAEMLHRGGRPYCWLAQRRQRCGVWLDLCVVMPVGSYLLLLLLLLLTLLLLLAAIFQRDLPSAVLNLFPFFPQCAYFFK